MCSEIYEMVYQKNQQNIQGMYLLEEDATSCTVFSPYLVHLFLISKRETEELCKVSFICTCSAKHRDNHESDNEISISKYASLLPYSEGGIPT